MWWCVCVHKGQTGPRGPGKGANAGGTKGKQEGAGDQERGRTGQTVDSNRRGRDDTRKAHAHTHTHTHKHMDAHGVIGVLSKYHTNT
jgi:hypothetical protein